MALYLLRETHVCSTQRVNDDQGHSSNNWDKNNAQITQNLELNVCSTMACIQYVSVLKIVWAKTMTLPRRPTDWQAARAERKKWQKAGLKTWPRILVKKSDNYCLRQRI